MAYRNIAGIFGREWIEQPGVDEFYKAFPESHYRIQAWFTDGSVKELKDCTRKERGIESIRIFFLDAEGRKDEKPYVHYVNGKVNAWRVCYNGFGSAQQYFALHYKTPLYPKSGNDSKAELERARKQVTDQLVSKLGAIVGPDDNAVVELNTFSRWERNKLLSLLKLYDTDGMRVDIKFDISHATCAQLDALSGDIELAALEENEYVPELDS